ncbi:DUF1579 domain-containing protein [Roseomonas eburnea]|uniref:DUF1579 domain-containing protein n=1 Tax=Neoroseomonas eburnea TaxID=1346889 RepID=A0A9X9XDF1_9PROT|nr:DUF1579 domain-containing protein [Neoroseomonas eburnea]MBR0681737.1 DUF1579 domain-containing protein [Neoroseomonas eburnea]
MQAPERTPEHRWLQRLVGAWSMEGECPAGPGQPPMAVKARERVRGLGEFWAIAEGETEMPGGGIGLTHMMLGYDPAQGRFLGTFAASMMTYLWIYRGSLDAGGTTLTLDTEGPDMGTPGRIAPYQDIITLDAEGNRTLTTLMQGADGTWQQIIFARYRRAG